MGNVSMVQKIAPQQTSDDEDTAENKSCLKWSDLTEKPWYMSVGHHNHCRNPNKEARQDWCFYQDGKEMIKKGFCAVTTCGKTSNYFTHTIQLS